MIYSTELNEQPVMVMKECDSVVATSFQTHSGKFFCLTRPKSISIASEGSPPKENPPKRDKNNKPEINNQTASKTSPENTENEVENTNGSNQNNCLSPSETLIAEKDLEEDKKVVKCLVPKILLKVEHFVFYIKA